MIPHHIIKFLVNFFIFFFRVRSKHIGSVGVGAVAASVLLLVQSLNDEVNRKDQHITVEGTSKYLQGLF